MVKKHPRPDTDIARLADTLRESWKPHLGIEPWLRRRVARFTRMVQNERWSWDDIGRAMTLAGIVYGSGKPWTGGLLSKKAALARKQAGQPQQGGAAPPPAQIAALAPAFGGVALPEMIEGEPATDAAPYFAPVSLHPRQDATQEAPMRAEVTPPTPSRTSRTPEQIAEVMRRLRGEPDTKKD